MPAFKAIIKYCTPTPTEMKDKYSVQIIIIVAEETSQTDMKIH